MNSGDLLLSFSEFAVSHGQLQRGGGCLPSTDVVNH